MGFVWESYPAAHGSSPSFPELVVLVEFIIYYYVLLLWDAYASGTQCQESFHK